MKTGDSLPFAPLPPGSASRSIEVFTTGVYGPADFYVQFTCNKELGKTLLQEMK